MQVDTHVHNHETMICTDTTPNHSAIRICRQRQEGGTHDTQPMGTYEITHDNQDMQGETCPLKQDEDSPILITSAALYHVGPTMGGIVTLSIMMCYCNTLA